MIQLAHSLIAISRKSKVNDRNVDKPGMPLPSRLIEIGSNPDDPLRLVHTAGQTGSYVALSYFRGTTQKMTLTRANMRSLEKNIDTSGNHELQVAITLMREAGVKYLWDDSMCIVQDDEDEKIEALMQMRDIYSSSEATIVLDVPRIDNRPSDDPSKNGSLSIILPWTHTGQTSTLASYIQASDSWAGNILTLSKAIVTLVEGQPPCNGKKTVGGAGKYRSLEWSIIKRFAFEEVQKEFEEVALPYRADQIATSVVKNTSNTQMAQPCDNGYGNDTVERKTEESKPSHNKDCQEATRKISDGTQYIEAGKPLEALGCLIGAKDTARMSEPLYLESEKIHILASAGIAKIYLMQNLPAVGLDMARLELSRHRKSRARDILTVE